MSALYSTIGITAPGICFTGNNFPEVADFVGQSQLTLQKIHNRYGYSVQLKQGNTSQEAQAGDYIMQLNNGLYAIITPDIFATFFEEVVN